MHTRKVWGGFFFPIAPLSAGSLMLLRLELMSLTME